jgi:anti-anti-sigma factor
LALADALVSEVAVTRDQNLTTAALKYRLSRPARIVTDPRVNPAVETPALDYEFLATVDDAASIVVRGDVDSHSAPTLAGVIARQSRAGTAASTIDLRAVTHLGSAGVSVLADAHERARRHDTDCALVAPPGTPAHHVLSLVQLPIAPAKPGALPDGGR